MNSPIEFVEQLRVGSVEFVSPTEIKIVLDIDAPESTALNAVRPRSFPRVNSYILISSDNGYVVGQIEWIAIERSPYPKRKGLHDFGLIDLPFPLRKVSLTPVGILKSNPGQNSYNFQRGIDSFPCIGDSALLPTDIQLRSIVESGDKRRIPIGTNPLAANAIVAIDPDRLFGRHVAVLGNTGSGKSCSVAGLIQWSLDQVAKVDRRTNARFIILDPNGEYSGAFGPEAKHKARIFRVEPGENEHRLTAPVWLWNSSEWASFTQASPKVQLPILKQSLRAMRNGAFDVAQTPHAALKKFTAHVLINIRDAKSNGKPFSENYGKTKSFRESMERWRDSLLAFSVDIEIASLNQCTTIFEDYITPRLVNWSPQIATHQEIDQLIIALETLLNELGGDQDNILPKNEDTPISFNGANFVNHIEAAAKESGVEQYTEYLTTRIRTMLSDTRMSAITGDDQSNLLEWLDGKFGEQQDDRNVTIIDLSLVPSEITHIVTAVTSRLIFEALQRYKKIHGKPLPTVLVAEEAHTFIKRYKDNLENPDSASVCCQVFEKIAREGRKFGLGMVISSQRPSDLSSTVLSQCNTFLLHRITNDRDQEQINKLIPDGLRGLLRELPALPSQHAILMGWASDLPLLVRLSDVKDKPKSDDPDFWDVWNGVDDDGNPVERPSDWRPVVEDWQS